MQCFVSELENQDWVKRVLRACGADEREGTGLDRAKAFLDQKDFGRAENELTSLIEAHESDTSVWLLEEARKCRASAYYGLGKFDLVIPELCATLRYHLVDGRLDLRNLPVSLLNYFYAFLIESKGIEPAVVDEQVYEFYGWVYFGLTQQLTDKETLKKAFSKVEVSKEYQDSAFEVAGHWRIARECMLCDSPDAALVVLECIAKKQPRAPYDAYVHVDSSFCHIELNQHKEALKSIDCALQVYTGNRVPVFEPVFRKWLLQKHPELEK